MKTYSLIALFLMAGSFSAQAAIPSKKVLISVGDFKEKKSKFWKKQTCLDAYKLANQIVDEGVNITCRDFSVENFLDKDLATLSESFDYHIRITRSAEDVVQMDVTNWRRSHDSDFKTIGWSFQDNEKSVVKKEDALTKVMGNFFYYAGNELAYKAGLLVNGVFESNEISFDEKDQFFKDKKTGERVSIDKAVELYENESPRKKNYLRAGIEIGVQLSAAMAIYYKNLVFNQQDFDYSFSSGLKGKYITGDAILFDDNDKRSNYGHTYAGVMYYQTARSLGFNSLESALITFGSSTTWETMEYHEVMSINDQILTPIGGYVIGEATYQVACALLSKNSLPANILAYTINPNLGINHAVDKFSSGNKYKSQPDCKKPRWSDISVFIGLDNGQKAYEPSKNNDYNFGLNATVVNIDGYDKEGKSGKMVYDTAMVKLDGEVGTDQRLADLKVVAQVVMAAYHKKDMDIDERGQLRGYDLVVGVGSASTYIDRGGHELSPEEDFYGTVNILGATAHVNFNHNGFNIKADLGLYGDFAMVKSYSLENLKKARNGDLTNQSSIIQRKGYYYGAGASMMAAIAISKGRFEVGYVGQYSNAKSINERNRIEATSGDVFRDTMMNNKVYITYSLTKNLKLQLAREYNIRTGSVNKQYNSKGTEQRTTATLVYKF